MLLYSAESWALINTMSYRIDRTYIKMSSMYYGKEDKSKQGALWKAANCDGITMDCNSLGIF